MPVVTLEFFHDKTREQINPLVSEERMKMCVSALHDMGEVSKGRERQGGKEGRRERQRDRETEGGVGESHGQRESVCERGGERERGS